MNYGLNIKAFLKRLPLADMSGHQTFLAVAALRVRGKSSAEVATKDIESQWRKSLLGVEYNSASYDRATAIQHEARPAGETLGGNR